MHPSGSVKKDTTGAGPLSRRRGRTVALRPENRTKKGVEKVRGEALSTLTGKAIYAILFFAVGGGDVRRKPDRKTG